MQNAVNESIVDNVVHQFICTVPLKEFNWGSSETKIPRLSLQDQEIIVNRTVLSELIQSRPIRVKYQKVFLKTFLDLLEKQVSLIENANSEEYNEIHEQIYSAYTDLVSSDNTENKDYFKHYFIKSSGRIISLKEDVNLISEGTTGLRTWQAAIALSEWCIKNKEYLRNKKVLELGSGIGLTGITLALECSPELVYLSDCHQLVLKKLSENVELNFGNNSNAPLPNNIDFSSSEQHFIPTEAEFNGDKLNGTKIKIRNLPWEKVDQKICSEELENFDIILAADIVYDRDLFPSLVHALRSFWKYCQVKEIIFACTERNERTLEEFCQVMSEHFDMERLQCSPIENFIVWDKSTVHLLKFTCKV